MNTSTSNTQKDIVIAMYPETTEIYTPVITGAQRNVLIAKTNDGEMVFKFGNKDLVEKNATVSKLYNIRGIHVPLVTAHNINGVSFELYKKVPGQTLYEAIQKGMSKEQIKHVYNDVLTEFAKMSFIHPAYVNQHLKRNVHDIAYTNISVVNNSTLAKLFMGLVYIINIGPTENKRIFHSDITPKNIIVSDKGDFLSFVDMDNVCVCNKNYAFSIMAAKYKELGFEVEELIDNYRKISQQNLPANNIITRTAASYFGRRLLWLHSQRKQK